MLREYARLLSADTRLNVIVVDKTCELAGDSATPHSAIGSARWMPVGKPHMQHQVLREAVENQSPDVIIVDEISTPDEVRLWALLLSASLGCARQGRGFDSRARRRAICRWRRRGPSRSAACD